MDQVFKAFADPARRALLIALRERDGQTLSELVGLLELTRFGVMKHLSVLETAGLITTKKEGRFKYHFIRHGPLEAALSPWIEAASTQSAGMERKDQYPDVGVTFIAARPWRVWQALTSQRALAAWYPDAQDVDGSGAEKCLTLEDGSQISWQEADTEDNAVLKVTIKGDNRVSQLTWQLKTHGLETRVALEITDSSAERDRAAHLLARLKTYVETKARTGVA